MPHRRTRARAGYKPSAPGKNRAKPGKPARLITRGALQGLDAPLRHARWRSRLLVVANGRKWSHRRQVVEIHHILAVTGAGVTRVTPSIGPGVGAKNLIPTCAMPAFLAMGTNRSVPKVSATGC